MEIFKILGTIALDNSGAIEGIDRTTDKAEKAHYKISQAFGKIGDVAVKAGKVIASGLAVGATAMTGLVTKALQLGGGLEQNMGGSVAVFGDYAGKLQQIAKEAYSKMGLSASDYLATANKMGALFMGAGFDVETSLEMTTRAMQRAADVASIMGIDTSSAMEAIAGAAKGNFTMMDNLGVAMNETSLQAYALSKGITKSYSDMSQQEKIGLAMEMFLEKTAYAAGNYSKENDTLAGSLATAKAAMSNFLSGAGDANSLVDALVNASDVIVVKIQSLLPRLIEGLNILMVELLPYIPVILESLLPGVIEGAFALLSGLAVMLPELVQMGADMIVSLAEGAAANIDKIIAVANDVILQIVRTLTNPASIKALFGAALEIIVAIAIGIVDVLPELTEAAISVINTIVEILTEDETLSMLLDAALAIILAIAEALVVFCPELVGACFTIVDKLVEFLLEQENLDKLVDAALTLLEALVEGLLSSVGVLIESAGELTATFIEAILEVDWLQVGADIVLGIGEGMINAWENFVEEHNWASKVLSAVGGALQSGGSDALVGTGNFSMPVPDGSHAEGLDYVPYDGYIAELHKGEMVIPAAESMRIRAGIAVAHSTKKNKVVADDQENVLGQQLQTLIEMLADYFPQVIAAAGHDIVTNDGTVVAHYAPMFNKELGRISTRKDRGR